ncbi:fibronectin type III domain-containing protein [Armatimonas rosea]|uniref:Uncharacterized protein n=1 Tax=Armatimonas rosea TaxID=685828 RepID=A0A7W9W9T7_ARMRO|nr:fibronectin type III domain-containing protein [Armatimonas rosea]MBB6053641.1 hypothetical protein [Armatimonas rosea]
MMSSVKLHLQNLPIAEKLALARRILAKVNGNPDLPQTQALLAETTALVEALEAAETKAQGSRQQAIADTLARDAQEKVVDRGLRLLAEAVEKETGGDAAKIHGAGKSGWRMGGVSTKSRHDIQGLASGPRYHVRVAAIGAAGQSPFSDAIDKIAP